MKNTLVGFDELFELVNPLATKPFRGAVVPDLEVADAMLRGEGILKGGFPVRWCGGQSSPGVVVWASGYYLLLRRDFLNTLLSCGLTGFSEYAVDLRGKAGEPLVDHVGIAVSGRCDPRDLTPSEVILHKYPASWSPRFQGHYFPWSSWDGSDVFMHRADEQGKSGRTILCTAAVKRAFSRAKVRNVLWRRLTEVTTDASVFTIGLRYRLPVDYHERLRRAYQVAGVPFPGTRAPDGVV